MTSRLRALLIGCASVVLLAVAVAAPASASGPFPITESFRNTTADPAWEFDGATAALTAATDGPGNGWLRLTPNQNNKFGFVRNELAFPSDRGILAEFEYAAWGGTGADGLTFFLYDGTTDPSAFRIGPAGGSIGYTRCGASAGLKNAYIGVAFDEWGNFANDGFCPGMSGFAPGLQANRVTIRGSEAADYPYLTSVATSQSLQATRDQARNVKVAITPDMKMSVYITYPNGQIQTVTSNYQLPAAPASLKLGFVGATGGSNNNHEIRNTQVVKPTDLVTTVTDTPDRSTAHTWTATVTNTGPNPTSNSTIKASTDTAGLSDVSWTCTSSGGATCLFASGAGMPDTMADLPVGGSVSYAITADVTAADYASLTVASDTGAGEDTGELNPTDNTVVRTTDLTPVADVAPTATLAANGTVSQTQGTWRGGSLSYARNWQRCDADGTNCADIAGATGATYATQAADEGRALRLRVRATNAAGATDAYSAALALPDTAIVSGPAARVASGTADFGFSTTGAAGTTYECAIDGAAFAACSDPQSYASLADGGHTLQVRARYGGLVDPTPASHTWTIDRSTEVTLAAPTAGTTATARPTVTGTAEPGAAISIAADGVQVATGVAAGDGTYSIQLPAGLADGPHTIAVHAADDLGNTDDESVSLTVDTTGPDVPQVTTAPAALTSTPTATFVVGAEPGSTFECRIDDGPWQACAMPVTLEHLADGPHTFSVAAIDPWGNRSARVDRSWTVDTSAPEAPPVIAGPPTRTTLGGARFDVSSEPGSSLECSLDGAAFGPCTSPIVFDGLAAGAHALLVRQIDAAGNAGPASRYDWTVSKAAAPAEKAPSSLRARIASRTTAADNRHVSVGCVLNRASLRWCTVRAYKVGARGRHTLVGTGRATVARSGQRSTVVRVRLNARGQRMIGRALGGMKVHLSARARGRGSRLLAAGTSTVLYPQQVTTLPTINPFVFDSIRMINAAAYRALRSIAADISSAKSVTCVGHTDSLGSPAYNRALGLRRAQTVCRALRRLGVKARMRAISAGETQPRATNETAEGRLRNRRVELRIAY